VNFVANVFGHFVEAVISLTIVSKATRRSGDNVLGKIAFKKIWNAVAVLIHEHLRHLLECLPLISGHVFEAVVGFSIKDDGGHGAFLPEMALGNKVDTLNYTGGAVLLKPDSIRYVGILIVNPPSVTSLLMTGVCISFRSDAAERVDGQSYRVVYQCSAQRRVQSLFHDS
jgi:hypothetical protein